MLHIERRVLSNYLQLKSFEWIFSSHQNVDTQHFYQISFTAVNTF